GETWFLPGVQAVSVNTTTVDAAARAATKRGRVMGFSLCGNARTQSERHCLERKNRSDVSGKPLTSLAQRVQATHCVRQRRTRSQRFDVTAMRLVNERHVCAHLNA